MRKPPPNLGLHLWLDANIELNLSREAVEIVGKLLRDHVSYLKDNAARSREPQSHLCAELETAANHVRAHLQHLPPAGVPLHHEQPPEGFARGETGDGYQVFNPITDPLLG